MFEGIVNIFLQIQTRKILYFCHQKLSLDCFQLALNNFLIIQETFLDDLRSIVQ